MNFEKIQDILAKEMSRKEFFQHMGIFVLGAIGITGLMAHFSRSFNYQPKQTTSHPARTNGYGGRSYGS